MRTGAALLVTACLLAGCSDDGGGTAATTTTGPPRTAVDVSRAELRPLPEGGGVPQAGVTDLPAGYVEEEVLLAGVALTYEGPADEPATPTGEEVPFVTRLLLRYPTDPGAFSGRWLVEPFNTSGGADNGVVWAMVGSMLAESGDAWVGVSVRRTSDTELTGFDPVRYADVDLPVNDVAWDVLRQVGGLLKEGRDALADLRAEHLYLGGYSQSGLDVATFAGAIGGDTLMADGSPVYDGYLPLAHSGSLTPLQSGDASLPTFEFVPMGPSDAPAVDLETQTDVEGFRAAVNADLTYTSPGGFTTRRDDSDEPGDRFRLYEVAGAPHAAGIPGCDGPASTFPTDRFARGATALLIAWAEEGEAPPEAERLALASERGRVGVSATDEAGNALGGVRSPYVDVPLVDYDAHADPGALCALSGRETPLPPAELAGRYGDADGYVAEFTEALDAAIEAGFLREAEREEIVADATEAAGTAFG